MRRKLLRFSDSLEELCVSLHVPDKLDGPLLKDGFFFGHPCLDLFYQSLTKERAPRVLCVVGIFEAPVLQAAFGSGLKSKLWN